MSTKPLENGVRLEFPKGQGVAFDADAFDAAIRSQGVQLVHWRTFRCPVGLVDLYDDRRVHDDHSGCSNGMIHKKAGVVTGTFMASGSKLDQNDIGLLDGSTVQITTPRTYDDPSTEPIQILPFDRLFLQEEAITVPHWQLVEAHVTGRDRLDFPAVRVLDLMDSTGKSYDSSAFTIQDGQIVWKQGAGPGFDPISDKGVIYSVRYEYRPYFIIQRIIHQVRVAQTENMIERKVTRMPQQFIAQREYVSMKEAKDDQAPGADGQRQVMGPRNGLFGPR